MKVNQYLSKQLSKELQEIVKLYLKQITCTHKWEQYGHGYKCLRCEYYTGYQPKLINMIERVFKTLLNAPEKPED